MIYLFDMMLLLHTVKNSVTIHTLIRKMEPPQIGVQRRSRIRSKLGAALAAFGAFGDPGGKHHTGGLPADLAVGFWQQL